jgi:hypothetical protein
MSQSGSGATMRSLSLFVPATTWIAPHYSNTPCEPLLLSMKHRAITWLEIVYNLRADQTEQGRWECALGTEYTLSSGQTPMTGCLLMRSKPADTLRTQSMLVATLCVRACRIHVSYWKITVAGLCILASVARSQCVWTGFTVMGHCRCAR